MLKTDVPKDKKDAKVIKKTPDSEKSKSPISEKEIHKQTSVSVTTPTKNLEENKSGNKEKSESDSEVSNDEYTDDEDAGEDSEVTYNDGVEGNELQEFCSDSPVIDYVLLNLASDLATNGCKWDIDFADGGVGLGTLFRTVLMLGKGSNNQKAKNYLIDKIIKVEDPIQNEKKVASENEVTPESKNDSQEFKIYSEKEKLSSPPSNSLRSSSFLETTSKVFFYLCKKTKNTNKSGKIAGGFLVGATNVDPNELNRLGLKDLLPIEVLPEEHKTMGKPTISQHELKNRFSGMFPELEKNKSDSKMQKPPEENEPNLIQKTSQEVPKQNNNKI